MKIGLVTHNVLRGDGQGRVNYELTHALRAAGHDVELIAANVAPEVLDAGVTWVPVRYRINTLDLVRSWDFAQRVDALWPRISPRYDVTLACGFVMRRPHTINAVHFVHGTWLKSPYHSSRVRRSARGLYHRVYSMCNARWELQTFALARRVVAVSAMVRDELREIGVPDEKLSVIVNGVDPQEFAPGRRIDRLWDSRRTCHFACSWVISGLPIKNFDVLIRALADAPGVHVAAAGGLRGSPYPAMAEQLGVSNRVHFLDFRRDIADLMRGADFFSLPSRRDSCPLVLLEALASGLPAIVTNRVGTADLVDDDAGFVIADPDDAPSVAAAMRALASDVTLRGRMSRAARQVAEEHSWHRMADGYLRLIESTQEPRSLEVAA